MADYSITAANVLTSGASNGATFVTGTSAAAITAGQSCYRLADGTIGKALANGTSVQRTFLGLAANSAPGAGQPITVCTGDPSWTFGATIAAGVLVVVSGTAGGLAPAADITTGWYVTPVGVGIGSNKIQLFPAGALTASAAA